VTAAGTLLAGWLLLRLARHPPSPLPDTLGFSAVRSLYRRSFEQRCQTARTYLTRYVLCLLIGPAILAVGTALQQPAVWAVVSNTLAGAVAMAALLAWMGQRARSSLAPHRAAGQRA
jgi:hypothetical protein